MNPARDGYTIFSGWDGRMRVIARAIWFWSLALGCLMDSQSPAQGFDWLPPTNKIVLLAVWAHPDDEGIWGGGSLPYYSQVVNVPTMLVCMTASWGTVRGDELQCAAWTYGLRYSPVFGQFKDIDSNIATNNPYTNTIDMTWDYWADGVLEGDGSDVEAGKARAINYVAEQIRRYRPDVIITHDLNGESGHDNHKATAYAVTHAFFVAADPDAAATNLIGLPPWQAQKLYVHLYSTNRLFHTHWETPYQVLTNLTPHQVANTGLTCHVSQGPSRWISASVYPPAGMYTAWPAEWWGLYASTVGPDTVLSTNTSVRGYNVPGGVAAGDFLEHISLGSLYRPPLFASDPLMLPTCATYDLYTGRTLADYVAGSDPIRTLSFGKISGPAWLDVAFDGTLTGTPSRSDAGTNSWVVSLTNQLGLTAQTTLTIPVLGRPIGMENLVGWWKLSETNPASPVAANSAPLSPDGTCYGGPLFGQSGSRSWTRYAVQFNGTSGKIDVPYTPALNPPAFTVALWANVMSGLGTYRSPLTSRVGLPQAGYTFYATPSGQWQFWAGNGSGWKALTGGLVVTNAWIHLAATYDGTTACFYTNGSLASAANIAFQPNNTYPLRIGAGATEGSGGFWFPGLVDDVRVYRDALDAAHVWTIYSPPPLISAIARQSDGTVLLAGSALPSQLYILLASSSRVGAAGWLAVGTNTTDTDGSFSFIDTDAANYAQRFYRLILP